MSDLRIAFDHWYLSFQSPLARLLFWHSINLGWFEMGHNKGKSIMLHLEDGERDVAREELDAVGFVFDDSL